MTARDVYCRECGAAKGHACTTKAGKNTSDHAARKREARAINPQTGPSTSPRAKPYTGGPERPLDDDHKPAPYDDLDDARRVLRNRTYGIVDDTLDPIDVLAEIVAGIDASYTVEQWEERGKAHAAELEALRTELTTKLDAEREERVSAEERALSAGGKSEQLEVDLAEALERIKQLEAGGM